MKYEGWRYDRFRNTYLADDFLHQLEMLIEHGDHIKKEKYKELFAELTSKDFEREIWHGKGSWWEPSEGYLAFIDDKGIMKFKVVLSHYEFEKNRLIYFASDYYPKKKISYSELIAKKKLDPSKIIITTERTFYEDSDEAFEITANSVSPSRSFGKSNINDFESYNGSEKPIGLISKYDQDFNLLLFRFDHEYKVWRKGTYVDEYTGCITMNNIQILLSENKSTCVDHWF